MAKTKITAEKPEEKEVKAVKSSKAAKPKVAATVAKDTKPAKIVKSAPVAEPVKAKVTKKVNNDSKAKAVAPVEVPVIATKIIAEEPKAKTAAKKPAEKPAKKKAEKTVAEAPVVVVETIVPEVIAVEVAPVVEVMPVPEAIQIPEPEIDSEPTVEEVLIPPPPPFVPTVHYSDDDLAEFAEVILSERESAADELRMLRERLEDLNSIDYAEESMIYSMHMAEQGSEAAEKEKTYAQIQRINEYLKKLDDSLARIKDKTYGVCRVCNILIARERLMAVPITTLSASYKIHQKCPSDGIDRIEPVK